MKCEMCNKEYRTKFTRLTVDVDGQSVRFENVPVLLCPHCGQSHITGDVMEKARFFARTMVNTLLDYELCEDALAGQASPVQMLNIYCNRRRREQHSNVKENHRTLVRGPYADRPVGRLRSAGRG